MRYPFVGAAALVLVMSAAAADTALQPPGLSIRSKAGVQQGVQGSYCIRDATQGICADTTQPHPNRVSVVRPGARIVLRVADGTLSDPSVAIGAFGCSGLGRSKPLRTSNGRWQIAVPRRPGAYELFVFARFATAETSGDTSAGFGVLVSRSKPRQILSADPYRVC
jgi:hypothetical protein